MSYYDRKSRYSIHSLIASDHRKKIIHATVGWPGSVHDARVLGNMDFMKEDRDELYFTGKQFDLGDSAFGAHPRVVPTYKAPLTRFTENCRYNFIHSSCRVSSENVNGMVKGIFKSMREIRFALRNKDDLEEVEKFIYCSYILLNLLLDMRDDFWEVNNLDESVPALGREFDTGEQEDEDDVGLTFTASGAQFREVVKEAVLRHNNQWDDTQVVRVD